MYASDEGAYAVVNFGIYYSGFMIFDPSETALPGWGDQPHLVVVVIIIISAPIIDWRTDVQRAPCNKAQGLDLRPAADTLIIVLLSEYIKRDSGAGTPGTGGSSRPPSTSSVTSGCWGGDVSSGGTGYQQRRGSLQLWQFLVALLDDPSNSSCISWTGRGMEFKLVEPEEVSGC